MVDGGWRMADGRWVPYSRAGAGNATGLTILAHGLSLGDLGHEVLLSLLRVLGETLLVGLVDGGADSFLLALLGSDSLLFGSAVELLLLLLEGTAEAGV